MLLLTLPGIAFLFQGDEIGMVDGGGRGADAEPDDRHGRDPHRHPMAWDDDLPHAGFTEAPEPWLPATSAREGAVAQQDGDPWSVLELHRDLIAARRELTGAVTPLPGHDPGLVVLARGSGHIVALNPGREPVPLGLRGRVVRHTHDPRLTGGPAPGALAAGEGVLLAP
jgi:alpha-glucosidase